MLVLELTQIKSWRLRSHPSQGDWMERAFFLLLEEFLLLLGRKKD